METPKCENACSNKEFCFKVDQYFLCECYQCIRTTISIKRCINCGNNIKRLEIGEKLGKRKRI